MSDPVYVLRWEEPGPRPKAARTPKGVPDEPIRERIAELRMNPGRWGVMREFPEGTYPNYVSSIVGRLKHQTGGGFEFTQRARPDGIVIYGRYLNGAKP